MIRLVTRKGAATGSGKPSTGKKATKTSSKGTGSKERSVLSNLPPTRPQRRSPKRDRSPARRTQSTPESGDRPSSRSPSGRRPPSTAAQRNPRVTPARPAATQVPRGAPGRPSPRKRAGDRSAGPGTGPQQAEAAPPPRSIDPPSGGDLLAGALQTAGDVAQAGVNVAAQILRSGLSRLPRP